MDEKRIIMAARIVSIAFTPFYLPLLGMIALFVFSYLNMLPASYKITSLLLIYIFTVLLPTYLIHLYRKYHGWSPFQSGMRSRRIIPYSISLLCYFTCFYLMNVLNMPHFMGSILISALIVQVICAMFNVWWKVSTHSAAIGGVTGGLLAFSLVFNFNPTWWLCLVIILAGMVGTSRMILRQHTLPQIIAGYIMGLISALVTILAV